MADYKFTQTGAEIQEILNKADRLPSGLYRHHIVLRIQKTTYVVQSSYDFNIEFDVYSSSSTQITDMTTLNTDFSGQVVAVNGFMTDLNTNNTLVMFSFKIQSTGAVSCLEILHDASLTGNSIVYATINNYTDVTFVSDTVFQIY